MKLVSRIAFAMATVAFMSAPLAAQALKPEVGKPLQQASNAAKAGNLAAAQNAVKQARAAAKTPAERTKVAQMAAYVHTRGGNFAQAAAELESIGAPASQLAPLYYQAKNYDKAIAAAKKSGQTTIIAQSYVMQGKPAEAAKIYEQIVAKSPNNANALQNLAGAQFRMGDRDAYLATTQKLIRLDPTPNRWRALLVDMKNEPMSSSAKLGLYHLMRETGTLTSAADIQDFSKNAIVSGQPGVAADVIKNAGEIIPADDSQMQRVAEAAQKRQAAAIAKAPADARSPDTALTAGNAYLGAGQYPQAIAAYTSSAAPEATLFKGIAQARTGDSKAAKATFDGIKNDTLGNVAALWSLYASTK